MAKLYIVGEFELPSNGKALHLEVHNDGIVIQWMDHGESDKVAGKAICLEKDHGKCLDSEALRDAFAVSFDNDTACPLYVKATIAQILDNAPDMFAEKKK